PRAHARGEAAGIGRARGRGCGGRWGWCGWRGRWGWRGRLWRRGGGCSPLDGPAMTGPTASSRRARDRDAAPAVVVVGSGIAGLTAALRAVDAGCRVTVATKGALDDGSTRFAQGGIAGVMFDDDRVGDHAHDTLVAGAG